MTKNKFNDMKIVTRVCSNEGCSNLLTKKGQHTCDECKEKLRIEKLEKGKQYRKMSDELRDMVEKRNTIRKMILNFEPETLANAYEAILEFNRANVKLLRSKNNE